MLAVREVKQESAYGGLVKAEPLEAPGIRLVQIANWGDDAKQGKSP